MLLVSWGRLLLLAPKCLHGCVDANAPCSQHSKDNLQLHEDSALLRPVQGGFTWIPC